MPRKLVGRTPFGEKLLGYRNERGYEIETLSTALHCSLSYLSACETGRKDIPAYLVERIAVYLELTRPQTEELHRLALMSRRQVRLRLTQDTPLMHRHAAAEFVVRFDKLTVAQAQKIVFTLKQMEVNPI